MTAGAGTMMVVGLLEMGSPSTQSCLKLSDGPLLLT